MRVYSIFTASLFFFVTPSNVCAHDSHHHHHYSLNHDQTAQIDNPQPNIIFIMADDAGWNDFSFHGSGQIPTPNIDALALNGMILNNYYVSPLCTPTRGAIMTGKHPIHLGLQHYVVRGASSGGLPLSEKLLPQYLKELGYATHMIGKWHLGHSRQEFLPTERGFDSHFGYWLGKQDYYSHIIMDGKDRDGNWCWGYDFRSNRSVARDVFGQYSTDILTNEAMTIIESHPTKVPLFLMFNHMAPHSANFYEPLQAPAENIRKFSDSIDDENRRVYAAMVDKVDESVGLVVEALAKRGLLSNSIIIFKSDNGAAPDGYDLNYGSNWPLRGVKNTLWEGGTRVSSCIWSPLIQNRVSRDLMHAQDWLPTLYEAAGGDINVLKGIDGLSLWKTFTIGVPSPRITMLYNIDGPYNNSAIRDGPWKLIQGAGKSPTFDLGAGEWDYWHGESGEESGNSSKLIPQITSSKAGKALVSAGFKLNVTSMQQMQEDARVLCNRHKDEVIPCDPAQAPCLFHVDDDPCELWNVADKEQETVQRLLSMIADLNKTALPTMSRLRHPEGFPRNWGNVWTTWEDDFDARIASEVSSKSKVVTNTLLVYAMIVLILITCV
ncbi:Arylsulfatase B [Orchesella cincta]|uniref:Arylsulfatase B n=1 Tax=Orchesella cincta TaxID=48709 RepID=A0A1D2MTS9_ORCCI|nr:Arylsulfatase B [Orchesella cincta]